MNRVILLSMYVAVSMSPATIQSQRSADGAAGAPGSAFATVSVGAAHACGLTAGGVAFCWGSNVYGQLGIGTTADSSATPVAVAADRRFRAISAGGSHSCGVSDGGEVLCWGLDLFRELGRPGGAERCAELRCSRSPVALRLSEGSQAERFDSVSAGHDHSCALAGGRAFCWGRNDQGQLGRAPTGERCDDVACSSVPLPVETALRFASITSGGAHSCGVARGGAYCWGSNRFGQLGSGTRDSASAAPRLVAGGLRFVSVDAGGLHSCGLTANGYGYCWGRNATGTLGGGAFGDASAPVRVASRERFTAISAGGTHSCALTMAGATLCWGSNVDSRLGAASEDRCGEALCARTPILSSGNVLARISAGGTATCGLDAEGIRCWGTGYANVLVAGSSSARRAAAR